MLLEHESTPVETRGLSAVATATIKATPKIFGFFADQTYSNKPLAICRELVSNAIDAHTAAGIPDVAVEVWLPTEFDPMFRVKDQGIGMSHEFMMTGFLAYTDGSTKDNSNDQIGGFGIGSKSPFAYTDQFTIRSVHQGTLSIYTMFKNEDGIPSLGLLSQSPTSEANGVEVNFPVETGDFGKFHQAAQKGLQHFNPLPVVYGGTVTAPDYANTGDGWAMHEKYGALNVVMGGVCYPVNSSNLDYEVQYSSGIDDLFNFGLDVHLPIGACGVSLSRESLSYDAKTSLAIKTKLVSLIDEITASFATMFDRCPTLFEASVALYDEVKDRYSGRGKFLSDRALYRGEPFTDTLKIPAATWVLETPKRGRRSGKIQDALTAKWENRAESSIRPGLYEQIIIDDLPQETKSRTAARIKMYVQDHLDRDHPSIAIRPYGSDTVEDLIKHLGDIPRSAYVLTSELDVPVVEKRTYLKTERPRVRMFSYDGREEYNKDYSQINPGQYGKTGVQEITYEYQPDEGVLVVMDNFKLPSDLRKKVWTGLLNWNDLRFVNSGDAPKLQGKWWLPYDQVFNDGLADILADQPLLPQMLALYYDNHLCDLFRLCRSMPDLPLTAAQQARPFGKIFNLFKKYIEPLTQQQLAVANFVPHQLPARLDPFVLAQSFQSKQPRAARLASLNHFQITQDREFFMELI